MSFGSPDVVGWEFQSLDVDGILFRTFADSLRRCLGAVCKQAADSLTVGHQPEHRDHGFVIPEIELQAAGIFVGENPLLVQFHGKSDGDASRNRIQAKFVCQPIGRNDRINVLDPCFPAKGKERLVLGTLRHDPFVSASLGDLDLAAPDRATVAVFASHISCILRFDPNFIDRSKFPCG